MKHHANSNPDTAARPRTIVPAIIPATQETLLRVQNLHVQSKTRGILADVSLEIARREVFGIIGPSGVGKSTLLKCLNRLIEMSPDLRVSGRIEFHQRSIFDRGMDVDRLRERIGMIFQTPVVFPKTIYQNVIFGVRHLGRRPRGEWTAVAERALREAALWDEVKDRLRESALRLSAGQQQRLCLARTLAVDPEVILMDEPTSALDPASTTAIEETILRLKTHRTVVLVTHDHVQAGRLTDRLAAFETLDGAGRLTAIARQRDPLRHSTAAPISTAGP